MLEPSVDPTPNFEKAWLEKFISEADKKKNNENVEQDLPIFKKIRQIIKQK